MARLNQGREIHCDRGQILLAGSFTLAVLLVVLAVVLNGTIAIGSFGAEGSQFGDGHDAVRFQAAAHDGISDLIVTVNHEHDGSTSSLDTAVNEWSNLSSRLAAGSSTGTNVTVADTTDGTLISSQNSSRDFTARPGNTTWVLADDVSETRGFQMNVSRSSLCNAGGCFRIEANSSTEMWEAKVKEVDDNITVEVDGPSVTETCSVNASTAVIDFSQGTIGGTSCSALTFPGSLTGSYNITYVNAGTVSGTFELIVKDPVTIDDSLYFDNESEGPTDSEAIYAADVAVTYTSNRLTYRTDIYVEPGDPDA